MPGKRTADSRPGTHTTNSTVGKHTAHLLPNGLAAIIKKEFTRFFTDRRMVVTTILMPGLLIYLIYSFIGSSLTSFLTVEDDYQPTIYTLNIPASAESLFAQANISFETISADEENGIKQQIQDKEADLLLVFPTDFDQVLEERTNRADAGSSGYQPPNIALFYNSTRTESSTAFSTIATLFDSYRATLSPTFDINAGGEAYDLVTDKDEAGFMFASLLPMLMMVFLYSGCIGVAPESIAGEKERGTIATLLVTPLKRWELALGKVVSLGIIALLAGASSFVGMMLSLPKLMGAGGSGGSGAGGEDAGGSALGVALYGPTDYLMLLVVILSTVLLFIGLISVISAFARTVKEANTLMMPLMIVIMLVGALGMFSQGAQTELGYYFIPAYNSVQSLVGVFSFTASPLFVAVTVCVNLALTAVCVFALTKMFDSEKIVFSR